MNICIVTPNQNAHCETFIRAHIERLPGKLFALHGGGSLFPTHIVGGSRLFPQESFLLRQVRKVQKRCFKFSNQDIRERKLAKWLQQHEVNAVLAEYGPTGIAVSQACRLARVPLIVHFHGFDAYQTKVIERYSGEYKQMFDQAAAIIAVSTDMYSQVLSLGAPEEKLFLNPYGIDLTLFKLTQPGQNPPGFISVGRFTDKKAPYLTILAFSEVAKKVPEASLVMIGDGPLMEVCRRLVSFLGLEGRVLFKGVCPPEEVSLLMGTSRGFVQHSLRPQWGEKAGDSEGTPLAVLEAMASGLPVVATRHAGIADAVIDGKCGLLCEEGDVQAMAVNLLKIAQDPDLAGQLGKQARKRAEREYSMEKSIGNLASILKRCANKES